MREVVAHGVAGRLGQAGRNGIAHGPVLAQRRAPGAGVLEIMRKLREIGIEALVEQLADHTHQHGVAEASGDGDMEGAVMDHRGFARVLDISHRNQRGIDASNILPGRHARGLLGDGAFQEFAGAQQLERTFDDG